MVEKLQGCGYMSFDAQLSRSLTRKCYTEDFIDSFQPSSLLNLVEAIFSVTPASSAILLLRHLPRALLMAAFHFSRATLLHACWATVYFSALGGLGGLHA